MTCPAFVEEADDAVGQLAKGHRVKGRRIEPIDDERATAADPFEAFAGRTLCGCRTLEFKVGCRKFTDGCADRPSC
jgi:hypothetical protein